LGTASIVLAIIGIRIAWIPHVGWAGVILGLLGLIASVPSIAYWHQKPGYTGWGISGLFLGVWSVSLGLAYQTKHLKGVLDHLVMEVSLLQVTAIWIVAGVLTAVGLYIARVKHQHLGTLLSAIALTAVILGSAWGLRTADNAYLANYETNTVRLNAP
jgi:hypothetical protein